QQVLVEAVVPLHGHFHADPVIALNVEVEHRVDGGLVLVQVFNKGTQPAFVTEQLTLAGALIDQMDAHSRVEERQLAQSLRSEEHTSELQSRENLVCRLLLEK